MSNKNRHCCFFVLSILLLSGCKLIQPNTMMITPKDFYFSEFLPSETEYRIKPYDRLSIHISTNNGNNLISISENTPQQNNNLGELEFTVEFDGLVKLPTIGRINLSGQTIRQAEKTLEEEYSASYQNPFVIIKVVNRRVFLFKDNSTAGIVVPIPEENLTLIEAIAHSGGLSEYDKAYQIKLVRGNPANTPQVFLYNIRNLSDLAGTNLQLEANDIIYIESRPRYVWRVVSELAPYMTVLTSALLIISLFKL